MNYITEPGKIQKSNLKIAVQKKGRLNEKSIDLLRSAGIEIESYSEKLIISSSNFCLDILFLRDDDIPEYVQDGVADIGIVGEDVIAEKNLEITILQKLGFGKCKMAIASKENEPINLPEELNGKIIATSFPGILSTYLNQNNIKAKIIELNGSVEIAPSLGIADAICDIVSTGNTLKFNKLKAGFTIFESEAALITSSKNGLTLQKKTILKELLNRIQSALIARNSKYLMMNAPVDNLERISKLIPSLKSPTVLSLADPKMVAIHAVIPGKIFWSLVEDLKSAGASGILLLPIENMII